MTEGVYGYQKESAAKIALGVMAEHEAGFERIIACCFSDEDQAVYESIRG